MFKTLKKASAALGAILTALLWSATTAFGADGGTAYFPFLPDVPFESTANIDPKTTVFLYLGECADENLRRIYAEYNKEIAESGSPFYQYLDEEAVEWKEIVKAAAIEHDVAFGKIEAESKTPEEKEERVRLFYKRLRVPASLSLEEKRRLAIEFETERYWSKVRGPSPYMRAELRVAQERWERIEREFWPSVVEKIDWENLNLDGARFDFRPEVSDVDDYEDLYGGLWDKFGEPYPVGGRTLCWGIPATLEELRRTKSWRDKTLRAAEFYRVFADASFAGWTLEDCRFLANQYNQGATEFDSNDGTGIPPELRVPGDLWRSSGKIGSKSDKIVGYDACDFADATLRNVYFDRTATISFEQFAATRSFKEDEIIAKFGFTIAGWDFSGKNVGDLFFEMGMYEPELSAIRRKGGKTGWASLKLDGARFDPRGARAYSRRLPDSLWRSSRRFREKDLSGATFDVELNGGDFSGFDLTGATMRLTSPPLKLRLDGATIRGLRVVDLDGSDNFIGAIGVETLRASKSWQDRDLRDVDFNRIFDFSKVDDLRGFDLRGARFAFQAQTSEMEKIDLTGAKIDGCKFVKKGFPTSRQRKTTETWRVGRFDLVRDGKTPILPGEFADWEKFARSPEFAAKDLTGKNLLCPNMVGRDLSGFNLTNSWVCALSLDAVDFTDATLDWATLAQGETADGERRSVFLRAEGLKTSKNYRTKNFRGVRIRGAVDWAGFDFAGIDWTDAVVVSESESGDDGFAAGASFDDAEIGGARFEPPLSATQIRSTRTFKEGRFDFAALEKQAERDENARRLLAELRPDSDVASPTENAD
ncbi:MAG: hypothetical protein J6K20_11900 [Thermoguttaceae bacterium]|nr:hypothetical protein [Thermoguttaceae bacterium]